jgi:N-acetylmuramoyl-L-alanine amidase
MPALLLLLCLLSPGSLRAQGGALVLDAGSRVKTVEVERSRGNAVFDLAALELIGAQITTSAQGARLQLFDQTIQFEYTSPFIVVGREVYQLAAPATRGARGALISTQFLTEWLPAHFKDKLTYQDGRLSLRTAAAPAERVVAAPPASSKTKPAAKTSHVVVIDAGHGGKDPGKIAASGLAEKNVTLAVSLKLARLLRERGYEVHLTRARDTLISLADRPHLANQWKQGRPATLFVSIHANSGVRGAEGFETYFLSEARTEDERRVAELENAAVKYEEKASTAKPPELDMLLNGLRNDYYQRASNDFAEVIQRELRAFHPGTNRGVKQAGFRVLVGALMPAVLVEIGFLSHAQETALLGTTAFQDKIAFGLARSIETFFDTHEHLWADLQ